MKNKFLEALKQHAPAVIIILLLSFAYFSPVLEGNIIAQSDIIQSKSMQGEMIKYREQGENILWTNNMFSGMPTYQISHYTGTSYVSEVMIWFIKIFGNPVYFLVLGMLSVYIAALSLNINKWLALLAAIGFAFSSFFMISIEAGHTSKVRSIALLAPFIVSVLITFRGKLLAGALLTAFFGALQIRSNHIQITYYALMAIGILSLFELYRHVVAKQVANYFKAAGLLLAAGVLALACNTSLLWTTYDYSKQTIRGGGSELKENAERKKSGGLDKEYAFSWSQGITESISFLVPSFSGGASGEPLDIESETYKTLTGKGVGANQAENIIQRVPTYWGNQPFTSGPIYFGAALLFLFLFAFLISKNNLKWAFLVCILLAMFLSWGKNFAALSYFFFDYVPLYNKFRTPAMQVCMLMLFIPLTAAMGLNELLSSKLDKSFLLKNLKISAGITLGLCLLLWAGSSMFSYSPDPKQNSTDTQYFENFKNATQSEAFANDMVKALKADRESMMKSDALRSFFFILLAAAALYFFIDGKLKFEFLVGALTLLILVDLWGVDKRYLNDSNFVPADEYDKYFRPRATDIEILQDRDLHFRVHDITTDPFNSASASRNLKTVGGYHAAKLQRYQDVIEKHIRKGNMNVLNMLNTKYFIVKTEDGQARVQANPSALGNAWAIKNIQWVNSADEEIAALENIKPDSVVIIDKQFQSNIKNGNSFSGTANVKLQSYHPHKMVYSYEAATPQFIVFSEVYYNGNKDWKSYIDGKETPHERVNYTLRGMEVPAGKHEIIFEFKPTSFYTGEKITLAANLLFLILAAGYLFTRFRKQAA